VVEIGCKLVENGPKLVAIGAIKLKLSKVCES
jgi:hypothetical protein